MNKEIHDHHEHENCCCSHDHGHNHHSHEDCCSHNHEHEDCCSHNHEHHEHHNHADFEHIADAIERTYVIDGLDCANCAAKMERKISELPQIKAASITFATKQLRVAADNPDNILSEIEAICRSVEDNVVLIAKDAQPSAIHKAKKGFLRENKATVMQIILGAVLFAAGVVSEHAGVAVSLTLPIFIIAYGILGWKVLWTAIKNIFRGNIFDENFLMSIATVAAFCIGDFAEGTGVMLFYCIGEFFEHIAVEKSRSQIMDAVDMRPETVSLVNSSSNDITVIPAEDAVAGDILLVRPGDRIPLDGTVVEGESRIDASPVTGEPVPVRVFAGAEVVSGCVNEQGLLKIKVDKPLSESMVTRILDSVENAAAGKPHIDKFITKFAKIYTPIVVALAILTAVVPSIITGEWSAWITTAITFLVISCPCALVISVPLAFFSGIGAASKLGILFKGGLSIEALKKVKAVVMDKTGTITQGNFAVQSITTTGNISEDELLNIAAACESSSTHPIAVSIVEAARQKGLTAERPADIEELSGMGIKATLTSGSALCGNKALLDKYNIALDDLINGSGNASVSGAADVANDNASGTVVFIALNGKFAGRLLISDTIKDDAVRAIDNIKSNGLVPVMLTGDAENSAKIIAAQTGIEKVFAQLMPEDKLTALKELRNELGSVMFVGDGINDAPVLAGADVGAAMGSGADAAIEAADVVFMNSSVEAIPQSINIAKATGTIAMQNVILALAIKLLVILLGFIGLANIWAAVFADTGVAMICILNSLRILWKRF